MIEQAVGAQPDMTVVGTIRSVRELAASTSAKRPHLVVVGLKDACLPPECEAALTEQPALKVLGIEYDAGSAQLYELTPTCQAIGPVSPKEIVEAIRAAGTRTLFPLRGGS
jgi:hypothetical protein